MAAPSMKNKAETAHLALRSTSGSKSVKIGFDNGESYRLKGPPTALADLALHCNHAPAAKLGLDIDSPVLGCCPGCLLAGLARRRRTSYGDDVPVEPKAALAWGDHVHVRLR